MLADCKRISDTLIGTMGYPRVNVVWIGNLVSQLHIRVIGRRAGDSCWLKPVWRHLEAVAAYSAEEVERIRPAILGN